MKDDFRYEVIDGSCTYVRLYFDFGIITEEFIQEIKCVSGVFFFERDEDEVKILIGQFYKADTILEDIKKVIARHSRTDEVVLQEVIEDIEDTIQGYGEVLKHTNKEKYIKTIIDVLEIEITERFPDGCYTADAKVLPGSPYIGRGSCKYEALYDLLSIILFCKKMRDDVSIILDRNE